MQKRIIHVDMDEFFAAVEKLDHPELQGKPLLIGGNPEKRGVVSTASYEARKFGCHSAMPMAKAVRLCPGAVVLPVRGSRYTEVSKRIFKIFDGFTPVVEPASIDEAFLDVTGCEKLFGSVREIAVKIKEVIRREVGVTASVGVAPNKFLAKLASDLEKPDGLVVIDEKNINKILDPLPVKKIWGAGPATVKQFKKLNINTIGQLRKTHIETLKHFLGKSAKHYLNLANGIDDREVTPEREAKSIGNERTFPVDISEKDELSRILLELVEQVSHRLRLCKLKAKTFTLKLRYSDFKTLTRSKTMFEETNITKNIWDVIQALFSEWAGKHFKPLRLLGVAASHLRPEESEPCVLFEDPEEKKQESLDKAVDRIANRYGKGSVHRGHV